MILKIDEQTKRNMLLMMYAYGRNEMLQESLRSRSIRLLYEQVDPKSVADGITDIEKMVERFAQLFQGYESAAKLVSEVKKFIAGMPNPDSIKQNFFSASDDEIKKTSKDVATKTDNVVRAMDSVRQGLIKVAEGLQDALEKDPSLAEIQIGKLFEDAQYKDKVMPKDKFEAGVRKAFVPSREYQSAFQKGIKASQQAVQGDGKTKLGALFSTIAKFFAGATFKKSSVDAFPDLFDAFLEFLKGVNLNQLNEISDKMKINGKNLIIKAAEEAGETGSSAAAAAGGAGIEGKKKKDDEVDETATPSEEVDDNLRDALKNAANESDSAVDAVLSAIDNWKNSLSKSSQQALTSGGKLDDLKNSIKDKVDSDSESVEKEIASAVKDWTSANEEKLLKSKKFTKKNLESLNSLIPQLAAFMQKKKKEGGEILTRQYIRKFVFNYMNKTYLNPNNSLNENAAIERWQKLAGIK